MADAMLIITVCALVIAYVLIAWVGPAVFWGGLYLIGRITAAPESPASPESLVVRSGATAEAREQCVSDTR